MNTLAVTLAPYFEVANIDDYIKFLACMFPLELITKKNNADGKCKYAECTIAKHLVYFGLRTHGYPLLHNSLMVMVSDVALAYQKALNEGCKSIQTPIHNESAKEIFAGVQDYENNIWWLRSASAM